jgi:hypothetical protein
MHRLGRGEFLEVFNNPPPNNRVSDGVVINNRLSRWSVREVPLFVPQDAAFSTRYMVEYPAELMIPFDGSDWGSTNDQDYGQVITDFVRTVEDKVVKDIIKAREQAEAIRRGVDDYEMPEEDRARIRFDTLFSAMKIYAVNEEGTMSNIVQQMRNSPRNTDDYEPNEVGSLRYNTTISLRNPRWRMSTTNLLGWSLSKLSMRYGESNYNDLSNYTIFVDLAPIEPGGNGRLKGAALPLWAPPGLPEDVIWNPSGDKDCFLKCVAQCVQLPLKRLKQLFGDCGAEVEYRICFKNFVKLFPEWSIRLISVGGMLKHREDGKLFKHYTESPIFSRIIHLMLAQQHYCLLNDPMIYVQKCQGDSRHFCILCGRVSGELVCNCEEREDYLNQCQKCGYYYVSEEDKIEHTTVKRDSKKRYYRCDYCERTGFPSAACHEYHTIQCPACPDFSNLAKMFDNGDMDETDPVAMKKLYAEHRAAQARAERLNFLKLGARNEDERDELDLEKVMEELRASNLKTQYTGCRAEGINFSWSSKRKKYCGNCRKGFYEYEEHVCYMKAAELPKELKIQRWFAFDFESLLEELTDKPGHFQHKVNMVCVQELFVRPFERWHFKTLEEFVNWIRVKFVVLGIPVAFLAHNLKGYDGRLTLAELFKPLYSDTTISNMVWDGAKIHTFVWEGLIHFRDSLLHVAQPLSNFPKVFGLDEMYKGYFPYRFNTLENQQYIGPYPPLSMYDPQFKSKKERASMAKWYQEKVERQEVFNMQEELLKYCESDVDILAQAMEKYYEAGQHLNHPMLPPLERLTIASYTYNCWRTLHFTEKKLAYHSFFEEKFARKALRGGRTDVRVFYKRWSMEDIFEKKVYGKYVDVQSMYPYVMYTKPVPVGKPVLIRPTDPGVDRELTVDDLRGRFGFVRLTISPPDTYVHHPPLVHVYNSKLVAHLKVWTRAVFTTVEVMDAVELGWKIDKIQWIMHYDQDADLFKDYIRKLISEKIHASSGPPEDFDQLAEEWWRRYEIKLEREKMCFNAGKRAISKMQVNSLWGKLAERPKFTFNEIVDPQQFNLMEMKEHNNQLKFSQKIFLGENRWFVSGETIEVPLLSDYKLVANRVKTNVAIGAFVTMWGRRMLWEEMMRLGRRTIYHDTDSIIYEYREEGVYNTPTGRCLGDWEEELPGKPMCEFVALGPKSYSYRYLESGIDIPEDASDDWFRSKQPYKLWKGKLYQVKEETKIKGMKLHSEALESINFDGLLSLLRRNATNLYANQLAFNYNRDSRQITSTTMKKYLVMDYGKGIVGDDLVSYPFGYQDYEDEGGFVRDGNPRTTHRRTRPSSDDLELSGDGTGSKCARVEMQMLEDDL